MKSKVSMLASDLEKVNVVKECVIIDRNEALFNLDVAKLNHEHTKSILHDVQLENDMMWIVLLSRDGKRSRLTILMSKMSQRNKSRSQCTYSAATSLPNLATARRPCSRIAA